MGSNDIDLIGDEGGKVRPRVSRIKQTVGRAIPGRYGIYSCAVPGISLTDYSPQPQTGWGPACSIARTTITLSSGVRITVATGIAELTKILLDECIRRGYVIRQSDTGSYNCRYIGGTTTWSVHAWALAIDINWSTNPYQYTLKTDFPTWMRALLNKYGFSWGGDWSGKKDAMHWQFMGTPAQAKVATDMAKRDILGSGTTPTPETLPKYATGSRTLSLTNPVTRGTDVADLQRILNAWYPDVTPLVKDGSYKSIDKYRVVYMQERAGLEADGIVGPQTWGALGY